MKNPLLLAVLSLALVGCGSVGTVDRQVTVDLFEPAAHRVEAYIAKDQTFVPNATTVQASIAVVRAALADTSVERIKAAAVAKDLNVVADAHDTAIGLDGSLDSAHRDTYLMTTNILRRLFVEALTGAIPTGPSP